LSQDSTSQATVPLWLSRPTRDILTIALLVAMGVACGVLFSRCSRPWPGEATLGCGGPGSVVDVTDDGALVAVAWSNGLLNVYDAETGETVQGFKAPGQPCSTAISRDGSFMAVGYEDAPVVFWRFEDGGKHFLGDETRGAVALAFSSDGSVLACWRDDTFSAWAIPSGKRLVETPLEVREAEGVRLRFSDDEKAVLVFPWSGDTFPDGVFLDTGEVAHWHGNTSYTPEDTVVFPTASGVYAPRRYDLEAKSSSGTKDTFTGLVMLPGSGGGRHRGTDLFEIDFTHVVAGHANALAFDETATRAVYVSVDGRVYLMRRARPGDWRQGAAPWVALGLGGAFLLWLLVAWRPGARHIKVEKQALAEAAEHLGQPKRRLPVDFFILVYLVALSGVVGIVSMIVILAFDAMNIDFVAFLNLFAAAGLLKFRRGWRLFVLFELWYAFFVFGLFGGLLLPEGASPTIQPIWGGAWDVSGGILWCLVAAHAAVYGWAYRTLTRFRTRVLFHAAAASPVTASPSDPAAPGPVAPRG